MPPLYILLVIAASYVKGLKIQPILYLAEAWFERQESFLLNPERKLCAPKVFFIVFRQLTPEIMFVACSV